MGQGRLSLTALHVTVLAALAAVAAGGCTSLRHQSGLPKELNVPADVPRELQKTTMPIYVIEPPDILQIDAVRVVPKPPYRLSTLDILAIRVDGTLPEYPVIGQYSVEPGGTINLGLPYGVIQIGNLTVQEATQVIHDHMLNFVQAPEVTLALIQMAGQQLIAGQHLVSPDGTVSLGTYGQVFVAGLTRDQASARIEQHLAQFLEDPEIAVDVLAYNSKVYYLITQGAGFGDGVVRLPVTGNETVLDAVSNIAGLQPYSSHCIWIARPVPSGQMPPQILPVDWDSIVMKGDTTTNYQLMPGDRLFVAEDKLTALDGMIAKVIAPIERLMGFTLLSTGTVSRIQFYKQQGSTGGGFVVF